MALFSAGREILARAFQASGEQPLGAFHLHHVRVDLLHFRLHPSAPAAVWPIAIGDLQHFAGFVQTESSCSLSRADLQARGEEFRQLLVSHFVRGRREGWNVIWRLRAARGIEEESRRLAVLESTCCGALSFDVRHHNDEVVWRITGSSSTQALLEIFQQLPERIREPGGAATMAAAIEQLRQGACA